MLDWKEFIALTVVGFFVVSTVFYYEDKYKIKLYPAAWSFGTGVLYVLIDEIVTSYYAIP